MERPRYPVLSWLDLVTRYPAVASLVQADLPAKDRSAHKELFRRNFIPVSRRTAERIAWDYRYMLEHHLDEFPDLKVTDQDVIQDMKLQQRETRMLSEVWRLLIKWKIVKKTADPTVYEIIPE